MKRIVLLLSLLLLVSAACRPQQPANESPTAPPVATVAAEPTAVSEKPAVEPIDPTVVPEEPTAEPAASVALFEPTSCETLGVNAAVAAISDCGYVTLPENRNGSSDRTIQLGVVRVKSTSDAPGAPLFIGEGGPGGDGLLFVSAAAAAAGLDATQFYAPILAGRDMVYFTQRSTKGAKPDLTCPEYDAISFNAAVEGWSRDEIDAQIRQTLQACYDDFTTQGVDFAGYNTDENAADVNDIRQALGYDKIIFHGTSYGTLLGQFLMRNHPEALEAAILDGNVPVEFPTYAVINNATRSFRRVFEACAADDACNASYPNLEQTLSEVVAALDANPQPVQVPQDDGSTLTLNIGSQAVLEGLFDRIVSDSATVPSLIYALKAIDTAALASLAPSPTGGTARMMHFAVNCADDPNVSLEEFEIDTLAPVYAGFVYDDATRLLAGCEVLNVPQLPDSSDAPVVSDLPVLLVNGGLDPATDPAYGPMVGASLPKSQNIVFPGAGHGQFQDPCAVAIVAAFAADPSAPVDTSCIAQDIAFASPVNASVTSEDGRAALSMTLPPGFAPYQADPNAWTDGQVFIKLEALPAGTAVEDALAEITSQLPVEVEVVDGPEVAGYPTRIFQVQTSGQVILLTVFANETGTYRIGTTVVAPERVESFFATELSGLMETVAVGEPTSGVMQESESSS